MASGSATGDHERLVDEITVFDRELTPLEVAQLVDGKALAQALSLDSTRLSQSQRRDLLAYYLATVDDEYKSRLAALKDLRKERSALVDAACAWDVVLAGDVCYERPMAERVILWLHRLAAAGIPAALPPFGGSWAQLAGLAKRLTDLKHP